MAERTAYIRLNPEALRHFPEMNYTIAGVPGRGVVTLTARDPVLVDVQGKSLGVPESFVRSAGLHKENVEPRDVDGALVNRIPRFKIADTPFASQRAIAAVQEDVFNAAGDEGNDEDVSIFNGEGDAGAVSGEPEAPEAPEAPKAPASAPSNGPRNGPRNGGARRGGAPDPTALP